MNGGHGDHGRVEGVDPIVRRATGVGRFAEKADVFGHDAVVGAAVGERAILGLTGSVGHHRHIDVIHGAEANELRFAAEKLEFPLPAQFIPVGNLDVFFCGNGKQRHPPCEFGHDPRRMQANADGQHHRHLAVVPTGMRGRRDGILVDVPLHHQRIQFAKDPDRRAVVAGIEHAFEARQGDAIFKGNAKIAKLLRHQPRRFFLAKSGFGIHQNGLGNVDQFIATTVDLGCDGRFNFLCGWHIASYEPECVRTSMAMLASMGIKIKIKKLGIPPLWRSGIYVYNGRVILDDERL